MIFSAEETIAILAGQLTQVRRPRRDFTPHRRRQNGRSVVARPFEPVAGSPTRSTMTIQRRRRREELSQFERLAEDEGRLARRPAVTIAHAVIVDAGARLAGEALERPDERSYVELGFHDARAEGHRTVAECKAAWVRAHDQPWIRRQQQTVDEHGTVDVDEWLTDEDLAARFDDRHAERPVWVIRFAVDPVESPRLLAERSEELYVASEARALPGEPPVISESAFRESVAGNAAMTHQQWRTLEHTNLELELALLSFEERLWRVRRAAAARHVNISSDLRVLERMVAQRSRPEAIEARLRVVEARVYRAAVGASSGPRAPGPSSTSDRVQPIR